MKAFGSNPGGSHLKKISTSPNYRDGSFQNVETTPVMLPEASFIKMLASWFSKPADVTPSVPLPVVLNNLSELTDTAPSVTWFGHSSYFIRSRNYRILIDPVFSGNASPVSLFGKSFKGTDQFPAEQFPEIDLLIITHDHYDHLDYKTVLLLKNKVRKIITPLGVSSHLLYWGFQSAKITELDWWESTQPTTDVKLTATPARHFSGRGIKRGLTLWSSFVLEIHGYKLFLGGDSGYDHSFKEIGKRFGPFQLAMLDCGQYGDNWPYIHMKPEETVQAALDLQAEVLLPVHWSKFALSMHPWKEPVQRVTKAATAAGLKTVTPQIGESFTIGQQKQTEAWWESIG